MTRTENKALAQPAQEPVISNEQYQDLFYEYCKLKAEAIAQPSVAELNEEYLRDTYVRGWIG